MHESIINRICYYKTADNYLRESRDVVRDNFLKSEIFHHQSSDLSFHRISERQIGKNNDFVGDIYCMFNKPRY